MKTRIGFVSNSSSTSFVILLPDNFDVESEINWKKLLDDALENDNDFDEEAEDADEYKEKALKDVKKEMNAFIKRRWMDDYDNDGLLNAYDIRDALDKYVIAEIEGGCDNGSSAIILDNKKIKKILGV